MAVEHDRRELVEPGKISPKDLKILAEWGVDLSEGDSPNEASSKKHQVTITIIGSFISRFNPLRLLHHRF